MLYADDLIITGESEEEVEQQFHFWKSALTRRGLKISYDKTKVLVSGKEGLTALPSRSYVCRVCVRGVSVNSVLYTVCRKWIHKRCFSLQNALYAQNYAYVCLACDRPDGGNKVEQEHFVLEPVSKRII